MPRKLSLFPRKKPKQERSQAVVESIVGATIRILDRIDFEKVTTTRIAELAGISVGSLYQYFPTKEAIYAETIAALTERNAKIVARKLHETRDRPAREAIRVFLEAMVDLLVKDSRLLRVFFQKAAQLRGYEAEVKLRQFMRDEFEKVLTERASELRVLDVRLSAFVLVNAISGVVQMAALEPPEWLDKKKLVEDLSTLVESYLGVGVVRG